MAKQNLDLSIILLDLQTVENSAIEIWLQASQVFVPP